MTVLLAGGLSSCSETKDDDNEFANWKERNEQYFSKAYTSAKQLSDNGDAKWKVLRSLTLNEDVATHDYDHVVVEVLNEGNGSGCPIYSDSVKVHYSGRLIPSANYPEGKVFDQSWTGDYNLATMVPATFNLNTLVRGFSTAVQSMHIGDRWRVTIPHQLGYGSGTNVGQAYSTLIFDITLVAYYHGVEPSAAPAKGGIKNTTTNAGGHWVYE